MSLLLVALAAASASPSGDMPVVNPNAAQPANCPATSRYEASRRGSALKPQKLNELPDADMYKAVFRRIGGCSVPIVVKYGIRG